MILDKAKTRKDYERTAIALTSDHGDMLGDNEILYKSTFLEPSIHVPMIYVPPKHSNDGSGSNHAKPVHLTKCLEAMIHNLSENSSTEELRKKLKKNKAVTIEFGNEILVIKGKKKLCMSQAKEVLWAIDLEKDPHEKTNEAENSVLDNNKAWKRLKKIGEKELDRRAKSNWIWKDIRTKQ